MALVATALACACDFGGYPCHVPPVRGQPAQFTAGPMTYRGYDVSAVKACGAAGGDRIRVVVTGTGGVADALSPQWLDGLVSTLTGRGINVSDAEWGLPWCEPYGVDGGASLDGGADAGASGSGGFSGVSIVIDDWSQADAVAAAVGAALAAAHRGAWVEIVVASFAACAL